MYDSIVYSVRLPKDPPKKIDISGINLFDIFVLAHDEDSYKYDINVDSDIMEKVYLDFLRPHFLRWGIKGDKLTEFADDYLYHGDWFDYEPSYRIEKIIQFLHHTWEDQQNPVDDEPDLCP